MGNKQSSSDKPPTPSTSSRESVRPAEPTQRNASANNVSYYASIKAVYQQFVHTIIRPPRHHYPIEQLGPKEFTFCGKRFQRLDFTLTNPRNLKFECSLWEPVPSDRHSERLPCVIYMHGNSSCRLESLSALSVILGMGATLMALDFVGSGLSEGEYVTLGAFEKDDLATAIEYLRNSQKTSTIALWGRSMGAATALLHAERDPSIAGMILDSSFSDLSLLADELVDQARKQGVFAPSFAVYLLSKFIRSSVQKTAGFDIKTLSPIEHADRCFVPALFIAAEHDQFITPKHSQSICEKYGGDKNFILVEGDHNSIRPRYMYDSVAIFLQQTLQLPPSWVLPGCEYFVRRPPWTTMSQSHPQRSVVSINDNGASSSERQRLQNYIERQQLQQQVQSPTKPATKPLMYESDGDDEETSEVQDGSRDISSLMSPMDGKTGLSDAETDLLMMEMMDEDEALALALAQSVAEAEATSTGQSSESTSDSYVDVDALRSQHELAMQNNIQDSLFSLLGGAKGAKTAAIAEPAHHRPLAKTKAHSTNRHNRDMFQLDTDYVIPEAPAHSKAPMSPTAMQAAESLLRQQQLMQEQQKGSASTSRSRSGSGTPTKGTLFFGEDEPTVAVDDKAATDASVAATVPDGTTTVPSLASQSSVSSVPSFPTASSAKAQEKQRQMSAKSSFHTFHTVFDQVESDQVLRQPSVQSIKSSSSSASLQGRSVPPVSASQLLSMADPFDDEIEVDVEVVDEQGNKRIVKQRRKKVDEFADDNDVPIHDNEIVGMDETLEELSMNLGSNSAEFWSHVGSKNASAQSSMRHIVGDSSSNIRTSSHSSLLPLSSPVVPKSDIALPPAATHDADASTLPPQPPTTTATRQQHSVSHAESLLLGDDDDDA